MTLSGKIMNIQARKENHRRAIESAIKASGYPSARITHSYDMGHRDARHEAAELAERYSAALERIAMYCGTPDAAEGCRKILAEIRDLEGI